MLRASLEQQSSPSLQASSTLPHGVATNVYVAYKPSDKSSRRYYITDSGVHLLL